MRGSPGLALVREEATVTTPSDELRDLYDRHSRSVYLTALRVTGNPADAEDVLQTVFLRIFKVQRRIDGTGSPGAYLRRAATNASIDLLRRRKTRSETDIDERPDSPELEPSRPASQSTVLLRERLRAALTRLSPENAELFVLCYIEGHTYDELAELFDIERGTVGSRLSRIRATLREELENEGATP